ncbi:ABC transporter ATP-binding protein [Arcanobacterium hippocoleae]|uniref:ABC-2 type transport system ATP-binding protein n=1 Tax=Arcanobacterium hippocoleae TaxID=149017 RepID=A0ABU1T1R6_9ACTO|nr:ABC transporter ATP-binding protein [Arcanobacterium hippocoleae]MDR6939321.1 ABC-2 type transport system ATP-binding protein [Arcanobacterium hippocoleae]
MSNAIYVENLSKSYGGSRKKNNVQALHQVNLAIPKGQIVGLMGENGCGKTTLLKILAGAVLDYEGTVLLNTQRPGVLTKSRTSFLSDSLSVPNRLTGIQVAQMYQDFFSDFDQEKALEKLRYFGVPIDRAAATLSKGQVEKMQIAMAMSRKADLYLLDEPLSGVDPAARDQILHGILNDFNPESTMIISTHLIQDIEAIVSYAVFMNDGKIRLAGDADGLREKHGTGLDQLFREMYKWTA